MLSLSLILLRSKQLAVTKAVPQSFWKFQLRKRSSIWSERPHLPTNLIDSHYLQVASFYTDLGGIAFETKYIPRRASSTSSISVPKWLELGLLNESRGKERLPSYPNRT